MRYRTFRNGVLKLHRTGDYEIKFARVPGPLVFLDGLAIHKHSQDCGARYRNPAGDAVVAGPTSVLILQLDQLGLDVGVPFLPLRSAGAMQGIADIEVREKLFATERSEAHHVAL